MNRLRNGERTMNVETRQEYGEQYGPYDQRAHLASCRHSRFRDGTPPALS
jgi:hypothetical protein